MRALAIVGCLALVGCGDKAEPQCQVAETVTYSNQIQPLLQTYCTECHATDAGDRQAAPVGIDYNTYAVASANSTLGAAEALKGDMPPTGGMSREEQCLLFAWDQAGAPQ